MIKREDLLDAIAECQGERNPNAQTCIKLAAFYTILDNMDRDNREQIPKQDVEIVSKQVRYDSGSEFSDAITGLDENDVFQIIDELLDAVSLISPKLYNATIDKLKML